MSIQKYARAQKQTVPASKFTYSRASLRDTKYWGRSLHATMCADLNYWSPRRKPMFDLKFEIWGFLGPCGQNKVATLHFMTKSRIWTKQRRRQNLWSQRAAPCPRLIRFQEREDACTWILSVSCLLLFRGGSGPAREICKLFPTDHFPNRLEQNNSG